MPKQKANILTCDWFVVNQPAQDAAFVMHLFTACYEKEAARRRNIFSITMMMTISVCAEMILLCLEREVRIGTHSLLLKLKTMANLFYV